jgi:Zn finger protein HypA/HybF involved in hydrogenase expression
MKNPLNDRDVNGNTIAWMADQEYNHQEEEWLCPQCKKYVTYDEFNHKTNMCYSCHWKI